jgi:hypothetical protein
MKQNVLDTIWKSTANLVFAENLLLLFCPTRLILRAVAHIIASYKCSLVLL